MSSKSLPHPPPPPAKEMLKQKTKWNEGQVEFEKGFHFLLITLPLLLLSLSGQLAEANWWDLFQVVHQRSQLAEGMAEGGWASYLLRDMIWKDALHGKQQQQQQ